MFEKVKNVLSKWWIALIVGILLVAAGIYVMQSPAEATLVISYILAIVFVITGVNGVFYVLKNKENIPAWGWDLAASILTLILAVVLLFMPGAQVSLLCGFFAAGILFEGMMSIMSAIGLKKVKEKMWWLPLVTGILMIIMAFMLAFNPVLSILTIGMWAGLAVIMKGIELIILAITMSKAKAAITQTEKRVDEAVEGYVKAAKENREELAKAAEAYVKAAEDAGKDKN